MPTRTSTRSRTATTDSAPAPRRWASLSEAADYLGSSEKTMRRMVTAGTITGYRMGRRSIRVDLNELDAIMRPIPNAKAE